MLILPAKTSDTRLARRFQNGHFDGLAVNSAVADLHLVLSNGSQGAVVDGFDKSIA